MPYRLDIPGQVSVYQLMAIEAVATLVPANGCVVEVGSLFGRSSWAWAASVDPSVEVHCFDPWERNAGVRAMEVRYGVRYGLEQFLAYTADQPNIRAHKGYSPNDFGDWERPVDLYYEDAVHTDPILARNLDFWAGKLRPGGIVCGDDFRPRFPDVRAGAQRLADRMQRELVQVENFWCLLPPEALCPGSIEMAARLGEMSRASDNERRNRGFLMSIGPRQGIPAVTVGTAPAVALRVSNDSLDPWPEVHDRHGPLQTSVHVYLEEPERRCVAERQFPLPVSVLEPDIPVDFEFPLPTEELPAGRYLAVFGLLERNGSFAAGRDPDTAAGAAFEVAGHAALPVSATSPPKRLPLLDAEVARRDFCAAVFADSHGAFSDHLGAGILYYALATAVRAQVAVCIGSGGGFVPSLLRRSQIDACIEPARTYLVDANIGELAFGSPTQQGGWMTEENQFLRRESDIVVLTMRSVDAARAFASQGVAIDYLHIDGDHSTPGVLADLESYLPLMSNHAVITLHDLRLPGVADAVSRFLETHLHWSAIEFREIGAGTLVLRRRGEAEIPRRLQTRTGFTDSSRRVDMDISQLTDEMHSSQLKSRFERWGYLTTEAYRLRYDIVARQFDDPDATIVEIGGFPNTILASLRQASRVYAIEPYAPADFVQVLQERAQACNVPLFLLPGSLGDIQLHWDDLGRYRLVALGLDLTSGAPTEASVVAALLALGRAIAGAEIVAIEVPGHAPSQATFDAIETLLVGRRELDVTLDLSKDPAADAFYVKDSRAMRRLVVFRPRPALMIDEPALRSALTDAAGRIHAARLKSESPQIIHYTLGHSLNFTRDGDARPYLRQGWAGPETRHTWTLGDSSRIVLQLPDAQVIRQSRLRLKFEAQPLIVPGRLSSQSLVIRINGHEVHNACHQGDVVIDVPIPPEALTDEPLLTIDLLHPDARRPAEVIEGSRDQKLLSFAVRSLAVQAVEAADNH